MYDEIDYYLEPEQELDFETETADPMDSYRFSDTLVINHDDA